ncbi:hypothetical protein BN1013_01986 [Candidatus Rubidus massiliensis]|nr:hypothetical protein BN1013_01986 [Candidatus Rubidus massiliensis]
MINIICALKWEADPLINFFQLKQTHFKPFPIYKKDHIQLIICGIGNVLAAAATSFLYAISGCKDNQIWLNIGTAGHKDLPIGSCYLIHKISNPLEVDTFYPYYPFVTELTKNSLISVDVPEKQFLSNHLYDMEAYGFYKTAIRFSSVERIHCIKVISDNYCSICIHFDKEFVKKIMEGWLPTIEQMIIKLLPLAKLDNEKVIPFPFHFTQTQRNQFFELLRKWDAIFPERPLEEEIFSVSSAKDLLKEITLRIDRSELSY